MCPLCLTTATVVAASTTSGAGVLGFIAVRFRALRRQRRQQPTLQQQTLQPSSTTSKVAL
jgi:hypothetical protein